MELTKEYSIRKLTYECDSYNAFAGIMEHFSKEYVVYNIWGIPVIWNIFRSYKDLFCQSIVLVS